MPQPIETTTPLVIWRIIDGKPGHENQTLGLANAMRRLAEQSQRECVVLDIPANRKQAGPISFLRRHFPAGEGLPAPDFILAAGSGTHWSLLCAQRRYGGKSVVLMKPSLPLSWFDWVVVPEHDGVFVASNIIRTLGVLNPLVPGQKVSGSALVLIGGPSKHFAWDESRIVSEVSVIFKKKPSACIADSRRTPESLRKLLRQAYAENYYPFEQSQQGWLAHQLSTVEAAYVTADSVSMVYEAITAGCKTEILLPGAAATKSRVAKAVSKLIDRLSMGDLTVVSEADRVARQLLAD